MKQLIENYLIKQMGGHPKHYYFYRWLAECVKNKDNTYDVLCSITGYINATDKNTRLPFFDIFVIRDYVFVVTQRPGLWIGKSGMTHKAIEYRMNHNANGDKISDYKLIYIEDLFSSHYYENVAIRMLNKY